MTTQEEIDELFIDTLEGIIQRCEKITPANVAHYVIPIKGVCQSMIQFYKENPVTPWHSVKDGDLPKAGNNNGEDISFIVKTKGGKQHIACFVKWLDEEYRTYRYDFLDNSDCLLDVDYWMEIPKLPTQQTE